MVAYSIVIAAFILSAPFFGALGIACYLWAERRFRKELVRRCYEAEQHGYKRGREVGERLKTYSQSELPKTRQEYDETVAWAEGLAALYPQDKSLQEELAKIRSERKILQDNEG